MIKNKLNSIKTIKDLEGKTLTDFVDWDLQYEWDDGYPLIDYIGSYLWDEYIKKWEEDPSFFALGWDYDLKKLEKYVEKVMTSDKVEFKIPKKVVDLTLEIIEKYWDGSEKDGEIVIPWKKGDPEDYTDEDYIEIGLGILRDCVYHYHHFEDILEDIAQNIYDDFHAPDWP